MNNYSVSGEKVRSLLLKAGLPVSYTLDPIPSGGNNRVYKLVCENGEECLLKEYFSDKADQRNRLNTEFSFLSFLWSHGVRAIPKPITSSPVDNIGLYQYIAGRSIHRDDITDDLVRELLSFFSVINRFRTLSEAKYLPHASDACFTLEEHLNHIQDRIHKLAGIQVFSEIDQQAMVFIQNELTPRWHEISSHIHKVSMNTRDTYQPLSQEMKVLSPSDFGFHNTIMKPDKSLIFIDFEYAGWDEPVKIICDLFCQPKVPINKLYFEEAATSILEVSGGDKLQYMNWISLLFPAYQIKWCCIILNEFLPVGKTRRMFADSRRSNEEQKKLQLQKAEKLFQGITINELCI
jgi:hypothetical protein